MRDVLLVGASLIAVLVLVWAASSGPVGVLGDSHAVARTLPTTTPSASSTAAPRAEPPTAKEILRDKHAVIDLSWLGKLIAYAAGLLACTGLFLLLRAAWRRVGTVERRAAEVPFEVLPGTRLAETLAADAPAWTAAVDTGGPRDGIVASWLRLEQTISDCGVELRPTETSTELVTRVLRTVDVDPRAIAALASLYREARFSDHPMDESSRDRARAALTTVMIELSAGRTVA